MEEKAQPAGQNRPRKIDRAYAAVAGAGGSVTLGLVIYLITQATTPINRDISRIDQTLLNNKVEVLTKIDSLSRDINTQFASLNTALREDRHTTVRENERQDRLLENLQFIVGIKPKSNQNKSSN